MGEWMEQNVPQIFGYVNEIPRHALAWVARSHMQINSPELYSMTNSTAQEANAAGRSQLGSFDKTRRVRSIRSAVLALVPVDVHC